MDFGEILRTLPTFAIAGGIISILIIICGIFLVAVIPKKPNWIMGYKTPMSVKNQDTWTFASKHSGKRLIIWALVNAILVVAGIIFRENGFSTWVDLVIVAVQLLSLLFVIISTEIALRKNFDKNGKRKQ